jgi:hypothetical protein
MPRPLLLAVALFAALPAQAKTERRCGWYHNPTPANVILEDADGAWWISRQGSAPAPGFDAAYTPAFDARVRIDFAGKVTDAYGYSCACADGDFDRDAPQYENVRSISRLTELPLSQCRADPALPPP